MSESELLKVLQQAERRGNGNMELLSDFGWKLQQPAQKVRLDECVTASEYWRRFGNRLWKWVSSDHQRKRARLHEQLENDNGVVGLPPEEPFDYDGARELVRAALPNLPEKQREAILLRMAGKPLTVAQGMSLTRGRRTLECLLSQSSP